MLKVDFQESVNYRHVFTKTALEELLATKLRALYQRKKGRDLYDFWYTVHQVSDFNIEKIIDLFQHYMNNNTSPISRAEFERNLSLKRDNLAFNSDVHPLLPQEQLKHYSIKEAYHILFHDFLPKLSGDRWKALEMA